MWTRRVVIVGLKITREQTRAKTRGRVVLAARPVELHVEQVMAVGESLQEGEMLIQRVKIPDDIMHDLCPGTVANYG